MIEQSLLQRAAYEAERRQQPLGQLSDYALLTHTLEQIGDDHNTLGLPTVSSGEYTFHPVASDSEITSVLTGEINADDVIFTHSQVRVAGSGLYVALRPSTQEASLLKTESTTNPGNQQTSRPLGEVALGIAHSRGSLRKIDETDTTTTYVYKRSGPTIHGGTTLTSSEIGIMLCEDTGLALAHRQRSGLYDQGFLEATGSVRLVPPPKGYVAISGNRVLAGDASSPVDAAIDFATARVTIPTYTESVRMLDPTHIEFMQPGGVWTYGRAETGLKTNRDSHHRQVAAALSWTDITEQFIQGGRKLFSQVAPPYNSQQATTTLQNILAEQLADPSRSTPLAQGPLEVIRFLGKHFSIYIG